MLSGPPWINEDFQHLHLYLYFIFNWGGGGVISQHAFMPAEYEPTLQFVSNEIMSQISIAIIVKDGQYYCLVEPSVVEVLSTGNSSAG